MRIRVEHQQRLIQYAQRLQKMEYRRRGNDSWYLKLVATYKPKCCKVCKSKQYVELHHEDGNWRNPYITNVNWYCPPHHDVQDATLRTHRPNILKEHTMRISWKNPHNVSLFQNAIRTRANQGMSARQVYADIAKSSAQIFGSKVSAKSLQKQASRLDITAFNRGGSRKVQPVTSSFY